MSANTSSIFYKIGQQVKTTASSAATTAANTAITAHKSANNTFSGTNAFQKAVSVGTVGVNASLTVNGSATVTGDLTVQGATMAVSTTNLEIKDNTIVLNKGAGAIATQAADSGFLFERASGSENGAFLFEESTDRFELGLTAGTGSAVSLGNVSLGALAINSLLIGTRASTEALGDYADFTAGLIASSTPSPFSAVGTGIDASTVAAPITVNGAVTLADEISFSKSGVSHVYKKTGDEYAFVTLNGTSKYFYMTYQLDTVASDAGATGTYGRFGTEEVSGQNVPRHFYVSDNAQITTATLGGSGTGDLSSYGPSVLTIDPYLILFPGETSPLA